MASKVETISILNDLIRTCDDSHEAFESAADRVHGDELRNSLNELAHQHAVLAGELETEVRSLGSEPAKRGHLGSLVGRRLGEIGSLFKEKDDPAILAECQKIEEDTLQNYQHALNEDLSADVRTILQRHSEAVRAAVNQLRTMESAHGA